MSGDLGPALAKTAASQPKPDDYLADFRKVGHQGYLYEPPTKTISVSEPELVILCTWMDAAIKHISKYAKAYTNQYPNTTILLVRSHVSELTWRPYNWQVQGMQPVASALKEWMTKHQTAQPPRVLVHVFSNGGSWQACVIADAYKELHDGQEILPVSALIVDSAPSLLHARLAQEAMRQGLPRSTAAKWIGGTIFWVVIGLIFICDNLGVQENALLSMRRKVNDPAGAFLGKGKPRLYIYSKTDRLVPYDDIILHASDARNKLEQQRGRNVEDTIQLEEFRESKHVAHMMVDPKRYWKVVDETWKRAMLQS